MTPKISAIMTVYNGERFIEQALNSIINQTYTDFELIIIDDGSTDNTINIINSYTDERIRLVHYRENYGVGHAIYEALKIAKGELIAKVDADDIYPLERFEMQKDYLDNHIEFDLVDGQIKYFPDHQLIIETPRYSYIQNILEPQVNQILEPQEISKYLYWFPCITHSTIMFRRNILEKYNYNPLLRIGEDYDFFYHLNKKRIQMIKIPYILGNIRISNNSTTVVEQHMMINGVLNIKKEEIKKLCECYESVYIWGTGELGKQVYSYIVETGLVEIKAFIDSDCSKYTEKLMNKKIVNISEIQQKSAIIVASSTGKYAIAKILEEQGYNHLKDYIVIF